MNLPISNNRGVTNDPSQSNFAVQVTSLVPSAQQMTINFSNNMLNGKVKKILVRMDYFKMKKMLIYDIC